MAPAVRIAAAEPLLRAALFAPGEKVARLAEMGVQFKHESGFLMLSLHGGCCLWLKSTTETVVSSHMHSHTGPVLSGPSVVKQHPDFGALPWGMSVLHHPIGCNQRCFAHE